jgi:hypothetical protein
MPRYLNRPVTLRTALAVAMTLAASVVIVSGLAPLPGSKVVTATQGLQSVGGQHGGRQVAAGESEAPSHRRAAPASAPHRGTGPYITFLVRITPPRKGLYSTAVWGKVSFKKGTCSSTNCGYRVYRNMTFRFSEACLNSKKHPFRFWVLPNGKTDKDHKITLKISQPEALTAQYR